jgi:phosphate transport system permease protein
VNAWIIAALLLVLLSLSYSLGWSKARAFASGSATATRAHSRPQYHGARLAIWTLVPAIAVLIVWGLFGEAISRSYIMGLLPADIAGQTGPALETAIQRVRSIASGFGVAGELAPYEQAAGDALSQFSLMATLLVVLAAAGLGIAGLLIARSRITPRLRARNQVERAIGILLLACSAVAILTTVGIVVSLLTEALRFFSFVNPLDFFFGTVWQPGFSTTSNAASGGYGILPLLWGTIMVSAIAMLVALPVGLMSAIWLNQYAPARIRGLVKPVIEILAGIPTIVYGFFALVTVGPFLAGFGDAIGIDIRATSALTAGVVMGVMIIPFISSLSDDILNQVPRAMRDGAYGLGATQSETIRNVLIPAALPGIVGAFLLAVSRAIGETMIVVLAAGNAPILRANPFEPTSTVTVSIVNQLTGDTDFAGPQSLVAFALGLTLFAMTLVLNIVALYIVRRFREQYE